MSAILRVAGKSFDVDDYVKNCPFKIVMIYRRGEKKTPKSSRTNERSGLNIEVSSIDFDNYEGQLEESLSFMQKNEVELTRLRDFPGVDTICIDYGADIHPPGWCSFYFPHALLLKAGEMKIDLELSIYPTDPEGE